MRGEAEEVRGMKDERVTLGDVTEATVDKSGPRGKTFVYVDIGSIDRERKIIAETNVVESEAAPSRAKQVLQSGDVLVSMTRPNLNAVALVAPEFHGAIGSTGFHVLRSKWVEPKFLFYLVQTRKFIDEMSLCVQGALYPAVRPKDISSFAFFLPSSLPTQRAIVAKIEELFSELDKGIEALKTAREQLKVYRQALLKHAFEGKLSAAWRAANPAKLEPAAALLARIQAEREQRHQQQLQQWQANGGSKPKTLKPMPPLSAEELAELPELPEGWVGARLGWMTCGVEYGTAAKSSESGACPVLRMGNIQNGQFDWTDLVYTDDEAEIDKYMLQEGDVLFNRTNSPELVGKSAIFKPKRPALFAGYLIRVNQISTIVVSEYLNYFLNSHIAKQHGNTVKTDGVNQSNINGEKLINYPFLFCTLEEQKVIVTLLDERLSEADQLELTLTTSLQQSEALRQSILKRAFSGQLVAQDANDEPASALLARIRAEKDAQSAKPRKSAKGKA